MATYMFRLVLSVVVISVWAILAHSLASRPTCTVRVCQNKDCRGRYPSSAAAGETLVRTFDDLLAPSEDGRVLIEASECLGQCGRGPNVAVRLDGGRSGPEKMYFGVTDPQTAAAVLEVSCDYDVPTMLLAASDVIARAGKATSPSKKISFLSSVIDTLSTDSALSSASVLARAFALRADARLEANPTDGSEGALDDAQRAAELDPECGKTWRILADAREAAGDISGAIEAVKRWASAEPSLERKAKGEVERLLARM